MSAATESADYCAEIEMGGEAVGFICGTRMVEHHRDSWGVRWCFHCRARHEFWCVVMAPEGISYYGPTAHVEGIKPDCTDLFPGWYREWGEE